MKTSDRILALIAYLLPVVGWLYIGIFQRKNSFAMFHMRQAVGTFLVLILAFVTWVIVGWIIAWIPYGFVLSIALYSLVIVAVIIVVIGWFMGMVNSVCLRRAFLPFYGRWADRLPL